MVAYSWLPFRKPDVVARISKKATNVEVTGLVRLTAGLEQEHIVVILWPNHEIKLMGIQGPCTWHSDGWTQFSEMPRSKTVQMF